MVKGLIMMKQPKRWHGGRLYGTVLIMAAALNLSSPAGAEPLPPTTRGSGAYVTPLAGEPFKTVFMGQEINIPARDRNDLTALTLGGTVYFPRQGDNMGSPLFALYLKRKWDEEMRLRAVVSIFVNDVQFSKGTTGSPLEFVALFSNDTIPGGRTEIINNTTQNWTSATRREWYRC